MPTVLPPAVAPILIILARSGDIFVWKFIDFTKLEDKLLGLYPYTSKSTISFEFVEGLEYVWSIMLI